MFNCVSRVAGIHMVSNSVECSTVQERKMFLHLGRALLSFQLCNRVADIHVYEVNVRVKSVNISGANVVHMECPRSPFGMVKRWSVSVVCECSSWIRRIYRWRSLPIDKRNSPHLGGGMYDRGMHFSGTPKIYTWTHALGCM